MNNFEQFKKKYPLQKVKIDGSDFAYRYWKKENCDITVVFLTGGLGISDLFMYHFEAFTASCSVLSFDYPMGYKDNRQTVDAIAELLARLKIKAWLVGQSYGGFVAQLLARKYPEVVEGIVLSNTGTLSEKMCEESYKSFSGMMKRMDKSEMITKLIPLGFLKKSIRKAVMKKVSTQLTPGEKERLTEICDELMRVFTKEYESHMAALMKDLINHCNFKKSDFESYSGKVLLILSDDDFTFVDSMKRELISLMPSPSVITDIRGGHLALLIKADRYVSSIKEFIDRRKEHSEK